MSTEVLNPFLYEGLERYFGRDQVEIVHPGEAIQWHVEWERQPGQSELIPRRVKDDSGEEYRVRCDVCRDSRARLHINHMWGVYDQEVKGSNLWMINCFNESCYEEYEHREALQAIIYGPFNLGSSQIRTGKVTAAIGLIEVDLPGPVWPLEELVQKQPDHPALMYLQYQRGFDPLYLSRSWDVSYCPLSRFPQATNRIVIPIYADDKMVGWQARYIGDSVLGRRFNEAGVAKYWSSPGYKKRLAPYNFDRAVRHPTVVIVEGPMDCWKVGVQSIGLIGKTMNELAVDKLVRAMERHGDSALVAIMLDPKQDPKELAAGKPHHIERLKIALWSRMRRRVVDIYLPEELDPGAMQRDVIRDIVRREAAKRGFKAYFGRPVAA